MTIPDMLTFSRIFLAFIMIFFLFAPGVAAKISALAVFAIASLTDYLDGFLARRSNASSDFGALMDPIADKILILAAFLAFVEMGIVPAWMVVIIILREAIVTGLRVLALKNGAVIAASDGGKHKMISQVVTITAVLVFIILKEVASARPGFWDAGAERIYRDGIFVMMLVTLILTVVSGASYLSKNKGVWRHEKAG